MGAGDGDGVGVVPHDAPEQIERSNTGMLLSLAAASSQLWALRRRYDHDLAPSMFSFGVRCDGNADFPKGAHLGPSLISLPVTT